MARGAKRRKCESYRVFEKNVARSGAFLTIFDLDRSAGRPTKEESELLRGAVVFSIGALDAFLHELVLELVPTFGGNRAALGAGLRAIAQDDPSLALRMALVRDETEVRKEFREALATWLDRKSFQGVEQVMNALRYVGLTVTMDDFDAVTKVNTARDLAHYTEMRHKLVHRGAQPALSRSQAGRCVSLVSGMGATVNAEAVKYYH